MVTLTHEQFNSIMSILNEAKSKSHCCGSCANGDTCESNEEFPRLENESAEDYMDRMRDHRIEEQRKINYGKI